MPRWQLNYMTICGDIISRDITETLQFQHYLLQPPVVCFKYAFHAKIHIRFYHIFPVRQCRPGMRGGYILRSHTFSFSSSATGHSFLVLHMIISRVSDSHPSFYDEALQCTLLNRQQNPIIYRDRNKIINTLTFVVLPKLRKYSPPDLA